MRISLSYMPIEWWYIHLANALASMAEVSEVRSPLNEHAGVAIESDLGTVLKKTGGIPDFLMGSVGAMFRGIVDLPCSTAVWSDFLSGSADYIPALRCFDVVFVTQKDQLDHLHRAGVERLEWLPFGFDDSRTLVPDAQKEWDVAFVGSLVQPGSAARRKAVLEKLEGICHLNDYRKPAFGDDLYRTYEAARMVVNIPVSGGLNMRTFEAMGCGALLLTEDVGNGQRELFKDGEHLVVYRSLEDLQDKVHYYLAHESERAAIARNGMELVRAQHTYHHRAEQMLDVMRSNPRQARSRDPNNEFRAYAHYYEWTRRPDLLLRLCKASPAGLGTKIAHVPKLARSLLSVVKRGWR